MNVPKAIMKIRLERATELERFVTVINRVGFEVQDMNPIYAAIATLRNKSVAFHSPAGTDYSCWGYNIDGLTFFIEPPQKHSSVKLDKLQIVIDSRLLCTCKDRGTLIDPLIELNFDVKIIGIQKDKKYSFGFHVDKHKESDNSDEIHPLYHLHYTPKINKEQTIGNVLSLDTPRLMHMPVDLVLGMDIVISNFAIGKWKQLREDGVYQNLCQKYQESFWKPYIHTWASFWNYDSSGINKDHASLICPYL